MQEVSAVEANMMRGAYHGNINCSQSARALSCRVGSAMLIPQRMAGTKRTTEECELLAGGVG